MFEFFGKFIRKNYDWKVYWTLDGQKSALEFSSSFFILWYAGIYTIQICLLDLGIVDLDRYNIHLGCFLLFYLGWGGAIQQYALHIIYLLLTLILCLWWQCFLYYSNLKYVCIFLCV